MQKAAGHARGAGGLSNRADYSSAGKFARMGSADSFARMGPPYTMQRARREQRYSADGVPPPP